jgi:hypothetical protein
MTEQNNTSTKFKITLNANMINPTTVSFNSYSDAPLINAFNSYTDTKFNRFSQFVLSNRLPKDIEYENNYNIRPYTLVDNIIRTQIYKTNDYLVETNPAYILKTTNPLVNLIYRSGADTDKIIVLDYYKYYDIKTSINIEGFSSFSIDNYFEQTLGIILNQNNKLSNSNYGLHDFRLAFDNDSNIDAKSNQGIYSLPKFYDNVLLELKGDHMYPFNDSLNKLYGALNQNSNSNPSYPALKLPNQTISDQTLADIEFYSFISHIDLYDYEATDKIRERKNNSDQSLGTEELDSIKLSNLNAIKFKLFQQTSQQNSVTYNIDQFVNLSVNSSVNPLVNPFIKNMNLSVPITTNNDLKKPDGNDTYIRAYIDLNVSVKIDSVKSIYANINTFNTDLQNLRKGKINLMTCYANLNIPISLVDNSNIDIWIDKSDLALFNKDDIINIINSCRIALGSNQSGFSQMELMKMNPEMRAYVIDKNATALNLSYNYSNIQLINSCLNNYIINRLINIILFAVHRSINLSNSNEIIINQIKTIIEQVQKIKYEKIFKQITTLEYMINIYHKYGLASSDPGMQGPENSYYKQLLDLEESIKQLEALITKTEHKQMADYTKFRDLIQSQYNNIIYLLNSYNDSTNFNRLNNTLDNIKLNLKTINDNINTAISDETIQKIINNHTNNMFNSLMSVFIKNLTDAINSTKPLLKKLKFDLYLKPQFNTTEDDASKLNTKRFLSHTQHIKTTDNIFFYRFGSYNKSMLTIDRPSNVSSYDRSSDYSQWISNYKYLISALNMVHTNIPNYNSYSGSLTQNIIKPSTYYEYLDNAINCLNNNDIDGVKSWLEKFKDIPNKITVGSNIDNAGFKSDADKLKSDVEKLSNSLNPYVDKLISSLYVVFITKALALLKYQNNQFNKIFIDKVSYLDNLTKECCIFIDLSTITAPNTETNSKYLDYLKYVFRLSVTNNVCWILFLYLPSSDLIKTESDAKLLKSYLDLFLRYNMIMFIFDTSIDTNELYHRCAQILASTNSFSNTFKNFLSIVPDISKPSSKLIFTDKRGQNQSPEYVINELYSVYSGVGNSIGNNDNWFDSYYKKISTTSKQLALIINYYSLGPTKFNAISTNQQNQPNQIDKAILIAIGNKAAFFEYKVFDAFYSYINTKYSLTKETIKNVSAPDLEININSPLSSDINYLNLKNLPLNASTLKLSINGNVSNYDFSSNPNLSKINVEFNAPNAGIQPSNSGTTLTSNGQIILDNTNVNPSDNVELINTTHFIVKSSFDLIKDGNKQNIIIKSKSSSNFDFDILPPIDFSLDFSSDFVFDSE